MLKNTYNVYSTTCIMVFLMTCLTQPQGQASFKPATPSTRMISREWPLTEKVFSARGTIRDADALQDGPLFQIEYEHVEKDGKAVSTRVQQSDLSGKLLATEDTLYDKLGHLQKYTLEQFQENIRATVEIFPGKVLLTWTKGGKTKAAADTPSDNIAAAGSLVAFMSQNIESLKQGNTLKVRLAVPEHSNVFNFRLIPQKQGCNGFTQDLCIDLSMSNFLLNKFVKPVRMIFQKTADGFRPLSLTAPAVIRRIKGNKMENFTALIEYPRP